MDACTHKRHEQKFSDLRAVQPHRHDIAGQLDHLPVEIGADRVKAECRDGILALSLPRAEHDKPRAIQLS